MGTFFVFGKSMWEEQPRLRHQVVELLLEFDNTVCYFQKPTYLWSKNSASTKVLTRDFILKRSRQLIHPQLRIAAPLRLLNSIVEVWSIRAMLDRQVSSADIVVNFNYDYYFLRKIFPESTIVTIVNDDFVAQARLRKGQHVRDTMRMTCAASDVVFGVSYPLLEQLSQWCTPKLFLPWADRPYVRPPSANRNSVLLWGHLDRRIDFDLVATSANRLPHVCFYIVGPQSKSVKSEVDGLRGFSNIVIMPPTKLDALPIGSFFAAIIPYKNHVNDISAVTLSNKALQLMSRGLPLVTHGMPNFFRRESIFNCADEVAFIASIERTREGNEELQNDIMEFVNTNQARDRYWYLQETINNRKERAIV
jgi:hypothetical protein